MVIGVNHLRKFLLTAAIACWVTLSLTPAPVEAATTGKTTKKAVASKTSVKRSVASTRKSPSKVAKTPTRKTASASRRTANRVKVQMAAGKSGSLHKVAVRKNPVAHAAVQPRRSNGERLGLRSMDDPLDLNSSVALVIDQETNEVLFSKNDAAVLPIASLTSAIPLVGVAPIAIMWFGFEWPSKAAVVVLMTFFPMLVSTLAGLQASQRLERELMHSYAASYLRTLWSLRLPSAVPFMFAALKVNASLALIGAIVAEFFGSPTTGLGFRISTEALKMNMTLVWAAVVVAAVTGSTAYALLSRLERKVAFWHPSIRGRR